MQFPEPSKVRIHPCECGKRYEVIETTNAWPKDDVRADLICSCGREVQRQGVNKRWTMSLIPPNQDTTKSALTSNNPIV
jgi:hypothetical protein